MEGKPPESKPGYTPPPGDYTAPYQSTYPGTRPGLNRFQRTDKLVQLIILGVFLMFLGAIIITAVTTTGGPNMYDGRYDKDDNGMVDSDKRDLYYDDLRTYDTIRDVGVLLGKVIVNFGMLIAVLALFIGGIINTSLDKFVRIGMIIAAGLIVAWSGLMVGWSAAL